jgi:hypothetical protein
VVFVGVVKAEKIVVSPQTYRAIRSFLDSYLRRSHPWNIGVDVGNQIVFYKPSKWTLTIAKINDSISLYSIEGNLAVRLTTNHIKIVKIEYWEREFRSLEELQPYYVYNNMVPNAVYLSVYVLAAKMLYYRDLTLRRV